MRFTTARFRQTYTLNPSARELARIGGGRQDRSYRGLQISSGSDRILDTNHTAIAEGWTDEERFQMERHLMSHPEFGMSRMADSGEQRGDDLINVRVWELWFAPDQDIPDEHLEFCKEQRWYQAWNIDEDLPAAPTISDRTCIESPLVDGVVFRCTQPAQEGSDYCGLHGGM